MKRKETKKIKLGSLILGGNDNVYIQSMTTTKTNDIEKTVGQILQLEKAGCDIIRVAINDMDDAKAISEIKKRIHIPLVCDIHFNYRLAIECIKQGCDKIRLNPGNIGSRAQVEEICDLAKEKKIPIRIGVNSGSLPHKMKPTAKNMLKALVEHIDILESCSFHDIVISLKSSNIKLAIDAYRLASKKYNYPLHLGITEAGTNYGGLIKSSIGIGHLLLLGLGSTIRVSLTADPLEEVYAAKAILADCGLRKGYTLTSCPTCGRIQYDMQHIAIEIEKFLQQTNKLIHVAVMGCAVNGPGEAKEADLGVAGGKGEAILFKAGKIIKKIPEKDILEVLKQEILNY